MADKLRTAWPGGLSAEVTGLRALSLVAATSAQAIFLITLMRRKTLCM
jgi:hypothetical protein